MSLVHILALSMLAAPPSSCEDWMEDVIQRLADPDPEIRLIACRNARSQLECGGSGSTPFVPQPIQPLAVLRASAPSGARGQSGKIVLTSATVGPSPFSPEPDTFLDTTRLDAAFKVRHSDGLGANAAFRFEAQSTWEIAHPEAGSVRTLKATTHIEFSNPGWMSDHDVEILWNGRDVSGQIVQDGTYTWILTVRFLRITLEGPLEDRIKMIAEDQRSGEVVVDASVGAAMRQDLEAALISRLSDTEIPVRRAAIASLAFIGREPSFLALQLVMQDPEVHDPLTRGIAAIAFGGLRHVIEEDDEILDVLVGELIAPDVASYRAMVAKALGKTHDDRAVDSLIVIRDSTSEADIVRGAAAQAINRIERVILYP